MQSKADMVTFALMEYLFYKGEPVGEVCMNRWTYELCKKEGVSFADVPVVIKYDAPNHMIYFGQKGQFDAEQT
jgi:hypothetical protein